MGSKDKAPPDGLRARLLMLIGGDKPFAWARRVGISKGGMQNLLAGGIPQDKTIDKIIAATGAPRAWLLYGKGEMRPARPGADPPLQVLEAQIDEGLMAVLIEAMEQGHTKSQPLAPAEKARLIKNATAIYGTLRTEGDPKAAMSKITRALMEVFSMRR